MERAHRWLHVIGVARGALALLACAGCLAGCSDADDPGCLRLIATCDISDTRCQREIFAATACTRGQAGARMPDVRALTHEQLAEELHQEASADDEFGERAWGRALSLFGLIPREQSAEEARIAQTLSTLAAYYSRDTGHVTIILNSERNRYSSTLLLSHEFVHALQDQREDLAAFYEAHADSSDATAALRCLTEGEAVLLSHLTMPGADVGEVDWEGYFNDWLDDSLAALEAADAPLYAARSLAYPLGGRALARAYLSGGRAAIAAFYHEPPATLLSWANLHMGAREPAALDCEPPEPPEGFELRYLDRHGMAGLLSLSVAIGEGAAYDEARAWAADSFAVYTALDEATDDVAAAWRIRLDGELAADELASRLAASGLSLRVQLLGQELLVAAASSESLLTDWGALDACPNTEKSLAAPRLHHHVPDSIRRWQELHHAATHARRIHAGSAEH